MSDKQIRELQRKYEEDPENLDAQIRLIQALLRVGQDISWPAIIPIIARSGDDNRARLMIAQHLKSQNNPRGELIEVQCQKDSGPLPEDRFHLWLRSRELLRIHRDEWTKAHDFPHDLRFKRGFITEIACAAKDFIAKAQSWFAHEPIEIVKLHRCRDLSVLHDAAFAPVLRRIRQLKLRGLQKPADLEFVCHSEAFSQLENLNIGQSPFSQSTGKFLAQSKSLTTLKTLTLSGAQLGDGGLRQVVQGPYQLKHLYVSRNKLEDASLDALAHSPQSASLERLALEGNEFTDAGFQHLLQPDTFKNLRWLEIGASSISDDVFNELNMRFPTVRYQ